MKTINQTEFHPFRGKVPEAESSTKIHFASKADEMDQLINDFFQDMEASLVINQRHRNNRKKLRVAGNSRNSIESTPSN